MAAATMLSLCIQRREPQMVLLIVLRVLLLLVLQRMHLLVLQMVLLMALSMVLLMALMMLHRVLQTVLLQPSLQMGS